MLLLRAPALRVHRRLNCARHSFAWPARERPAGQGVWPAAAATQVVRPHPCPCCARGLLRSQLIRLVRASPGALAPPGGRPVVVVLRCFRTPHRHHHYHRHSGPRAAAAGAPRVWAGACEAARAGRPARNWLLLALLLAICMRQRAARGARASHESDQGRAASACWLLPASARSFHHHHEQIGLETGESLRSVVSLLRPAGAYRSPAWTGPGRGSRAPGHQFGRRQQQQQQR